MFKMDVISAYTEGQLENVGCENQLHNKKFIPDIEKLELLQKKLALTKTVWFIH